jgi:hypothetical protein
MEGDTVILGIIQSSSTLHFEETGLRDKWLVAPKSTSPSPAMSNSSSSSSSLVMQELGVPNEPSIMSFAVSLASRSFEWGSEGLGALFATTSIFSTSFRGMFLDLLRFNRYADQRAEDIGVFFFAADS